MTEFERPTCHICKQKIMTYESHIGPPFEDRPRHMKCPQICKKCGVGFYELNRHISECVGHK